MNLKTKANLISIELDNIYPIAECTLNHMSALELLIATQLSAQCTDARVNIITIELFKKYTTTEDYANVNIEELEKDIKSAGFYKNKSKNIKACCKMLIKDFNNTIPNNMDDLLLLPGVGRKTANVVLGSFYGVPGIVVDTHTKRLSNRLGLSTNTDPTKIEFDLMKLLPKDKWVKFCHQFVMHGRQVCNARNPKCEVCVIRKLCEYYDSNI